MLSAEERLGILSNEMESFEEYLAGLTAEAWDTPALAKGGLWLTW